MKLLHKKSPPAMPGGFQKRFSEQSRDQPKEQVKTPTLDTVMVALL